MKFFITTVIITTLMLPILVSAQEDLVNPAYNDNSALKLKRLERSIASLERQLSIMNTMPNTPDSPEQTARANALTFAQIEDLREQVKALRGDIERLQFDNVRINEKLAKLSADTEFRFNELALAPADKKKEHSLFDDLDRSLEDNGKKDKIEDKSLTDEVKSGDTKPPVKKNPSLEKKERTSNVEQQYQEAYSFFKSRDYKGARTAFQKFIDDHPSTEFTGNAYYWLGETYYYKGEYDKAGVQYLKGYQNSSAGPRAADNLLKLAKSLSKLGKIKEACITYAKLHKEFPDANHNIKKQMGDDMKEFKCPS